MTPPPIPPRDEVHPIWVLPENTTPAPIEIGTPVPVPIQETLRLDLASPIFHSGANAESPPWHPITPPPDPHEVEVGQVRAQIASAAATLFALAGMPRITDRYEACRARNEALAVLGLVPADEVAHSERVHRAIALLPPGLARSVIEALQRYHVPENDLARLTQVTLAQDLGRLLRRHRALMRRCR